MTGTKLPQIKEIRFFICDNKKNRFVAVTFVNFQRK